MPLDYEATLTALTNELNDLITHCPLTVDEIAKITHLPKNRISALRNGEFLTADRVHQALDLLHDGEVTSYGEIAKYLDKPGAAQAVARILSTDKFTAAEAARVIPTSRIVGTNYVMPNKRFSSHEGFEARSDALSIAGVEHTVRWDVYVPVRLLVDADELWRRAK